MRSMIALLFAITLVAGSAALAAAGGKTDKDKFDGAIAKFAPTFDELFGPGSPFKPRGLCICTAGGDANKAGFLQRDGNGVVLCEWPIFLPDGSFAQAAVPCLPFVILSK